MTQSPAQEPKGYRNEIPYEAFVKMSDTEQRQILHAMQEMSDARLKEMEASGKEITLGGKARLTNFSSQEIPIDKTLDAIPDPAQRADLAYKIYSQGRYALGATDPNPPGDFLHVDMRQRQSAPATQRGIPGQDKSAATESGARGDSRRFRDLSHEEKVAWLTQRQQRASHWEDNPNFKDTLDNDPRLAQKLRDFRDLDFPQMNDRELRQARKDFSEIRDGLGLKGARESRPAERSAERTGAPSGEQGEGRRSDEPGGHRRRMERASSEEGASERGERGHGREGRLGQMEQRLAGFQERLERRVERMGGMEALRQRDPALAEKITRMEGVKPADLAAMSREERREFRQLRQEIRAELGMGHRRDRGERLENGRSFAAEGGQEPDAQGYGRHPHRRMDEGGEIFYPRGRGEEQRGGFPMGAQGQQGGEDRAWRVGYPSRLGADNFSLAASAPPPPVVSDVGQEKMAVVRTPIGPGHPEFRPDSWNG